jgi:hypothetical protein
MKKQTYDLEESRGSGCDQSPTRQAYFARLRAIAFGLSAIGSGPQAGGEPEASKAESRFGDGAPELPDNTSQKLRMGGINGKS